MQSPLVTMGGDNLIPEVSTDINFRLAHPSNEDGSKLPNAQGSQPAAVTFERTSFE